MKQVDAQPPKPVEKRPRNSKEFEQLLIDMGRETKGATFVRVQGNLASKGKISTPLCATDRMWMSFKTYAVGGENNLHAHTNEDHAFLVLAGEAEFAGPEFETRTVGKNEVVLIPRHTFYTFKTVGSEPLAILRFGAIVDPNKPLLERIRSDGTVMEDSFTPENHYEGHHPDETRRFE